MSFEISLYRAEISLLRQRCSYFVGDIFVTFSESSTRQKNTFLKTNYTAPVCIPELETQSSERQS